MNRNFGVVLLSAGSGTRMNSSIPKQYIDLNGHPVLYYSLKAFEENECIRDIVLVVSDEYKEYVSQKIIKKNGFQKVKKIVGGGQERYHSVYNGIKALQEIQTENDDSTRIEYIMIHDGARPFINNRLLNRLIENVEKYNACIPAVLSKDTVIISDENGFIDITPDRSVVWNVQTPQVFEFNRLADAFEKYIAQECDNQVIPKVTDDASVWRMYNQEPVRVVQGDYNNFKITTPGDIGIAQVYLKKNQPEK